MSSVQIVVIISKFKYAQSQFQFHFFAGNSTILKQIDTKSVAQSPWLEDGLRTVYKICSIK